MPVFFEFFVLNVSSVNPRSTTVTHLLELSLSSFEESTIHSIALNPPPSFPLDALPLLQDLICIRLIQLGKFLDAIRMGREFSTSKPVTNARRSEARLKMVEDLYNALPSSHRALVDLELADPLPHIAEPFGVEAAQPLEQVRSSEFQASTSKLPVSRSFVDLEFNDPSPCNTEPQRSPISCSAPEHTNASGSGRPIPVSTSPQLPTTTSPVTPRQNSHISPTLITPSSIRSRASLGDTTECLARDSTLSHVSSPPSDIKLPSSPIQSRKLDGNIFISAQQQTNAFYTPPKIINLTQPAFSPQTVLSHSGNGNAEKPLSEQDDDVEMEEKMEGENDKERDYEHEIEHQGEKQAESVSTEKGVEEIGYSLFDDGLPSQPYLENEPPKSSDVPDGTESPSASTKRKVPGSFSDKDEDEDEEPEAGDLNQSYHRYRRHHHQRGKLSTLPEYEEAQFTDDHVTRLEPQYTENPVPRKKSRSGSKESKKRRISQQEQQKLPGGLMGDGREEEEEQDHVAPLRNTRTPSRRSRPISRRSTSEISDDFGEGMQTRRRSSRLNATASAATVVPSADSVDALLRKSTRTRKPTSKGTGGKKRGGA